jgi:pyruvate,water dikinase
MPAWVAWFEDIHLTDRATVGGKGANLGEMTRAGLPVPPGFVVTTACYEHAMQTGGVRNELQALFAEARRQVDEPEALIETACRLQELVRTAGMPPALADAVLAAYHRLGADQPVAVRSSATAEDTAGTSFAGMHETFANVVGDSALLERLVDCWCSLYGPRAIAYRASQGLTEDPALAVVIQRMVASDRAGVLFTADPSTGRRDRMVIEGAFGLGEAVVSGQVEPDTYVLTKEGPRLLTARVGHKTHKLVSGPGGTVERVALGTDEADARVLNDEETTALARLGQRVEAHYGEPQDVEWAIADGETFLVQARPITALDGGPVLAAAPLPEGGKLLVRGLAASTGSASGRVRVLVSPQDGGQLEAGEVLVAPMTNPDWVPTIRRAAPPS